MSGVAQARRLAAALAQLPAKIMVRRRLYRLDIDAERRRVEYVSGVYIAASFTLGSLAESAEAMVREFINPLIETRNDGFTIPGEGKKDGQG